MPWSFFTPCSYSWCSWDLDTSPTSHLLKYYHPWSSSDMTLLGRVTPGSPSMRCDGFCFWTPAGFLELLLQHLPYQQCIVPVCEMLSSPTRLHSGPRVSSICVSYSSLRLCYLKTMKETQKGSWRGERCLHPRAAEEAGSILASWLTALLFGHQQQSLFSHRMISIRLPRPGAILFSYVFFRHQHISLLLNIANGITSFH